MDQAIQVFGSLLILTAFVAAQRGRMTTESRSYLWLNLVGAAILAVLAAREEQLGFLLLETVWALVAGYSLLSSTRAGRPRRGDPAGC
jgi:hypothetical protein